jgi:hypothetical protein
MSPVRADNAARDLLARLLDEAELESASPDEVQADLALLGVDPARSIRLSRQLAGRPASPATRLLQQSFAGEESDREIAELETANLATVQTDLGSASPAVVEQQVAATLGRSLRHGPDRLRPRRRLALAVPISAVAASLLLFVGIFATHEQLRSPLPSGAPPSASFSGGSQNALEVGRAEPTAPELRKPADQLAEFHALSDGEDSVTYNYEVSRTLEARMRGEWVPDSATADMTVVAVYVLRPDLAPENLKQAKLGAGHLAARIGDARQWAARGEIVALLTLRGSDGAERDGVLVRSADESEKDEMYEALSTETRTEIQQFDRLITVEPPADSATSAGLSLKAISAPPLLRKLLGDDIGQYRVLALENAKSP